MPGTKAIPGGQPATESLTGQDLPIVRLGGWKIRIKTGATQILPSGIRIDPNGTMKIVTTVPLSNQGGIITLLNAQGLKVHGVSYTKTQANGAVVSF